jgi:hypothetical protein
VLLPGAVERQLGIADRLAPLISDPRNPLYVTHSVSDILRARILAIACGYEDGDDLDMLRTDPGFEVACGRLPESGDDLCSQPTVSRWENAPGLREVVRMTYAMIDLYCHSHDRPPASVILDIDDTCDVVHGKQQLSLFNAHYDERCFLPIHVYDAANGRPVAVLLRPGSESTSIWTKRPNTRSSRKASPRGKQSVRRTALWPIGDRSNAIKITRIEPWLESSDRTARAGANICSSRCVRTKASPAGARSPPRRAQLTAP